MPQRILIVDDNPQTTRQMSRFLEKQGFEAREVNDPAKALSTAHTFQPSCVILDYLMPRLHGGDVAWQLASDPFLKKTKVIVCSGLSAKEIAIHLPPARIPILGKPVDPDELLQLLRSYEL